jgi:hypothetical protein
MSLFVVYRMGSQYGSPIGGVNGEWWVGTGAGYDAAAWSSNGQWIGYGAATGIPPSGSSSAELAALIIDSVPYGGSFPHGQATLYMSGAVAARGFMDVPQSLQIGVPSGGANTTFRVFVSEVLVFNRALFDSERQAIEGMLAHKYALSLPANHPLASYSPMPSESASRSASPSQSPAATYSALPSASAPTSAGNMGPPTLALLAGTCLSTPLMMSVPDTGYLNPLNSVGSAFVSGYPAYASLVIALCTRF